GRAVAPCLGRAGWARAPAALGGLRGLAALGPARERPGLGHPPERPPEVLDGEEVLLGPVEGGPAVEVGLPLLGEPGPALLGRVLPRRLGEAHGVVLPGAEEVARPRAEQQRADDEEGEDGGGGPREEALPPAPVRGQRGAAAAGAVVRRRHAVLPSRRRRTTPGRGKRRAWSHASHASRTARTAAAGQ